VATVSTYHEAPPDEGDEIHLHKVGNSKLSFACRSVCRAVIDSYREQLRHPVTS